MTLALIFYQRTSHDSRKIQWDAPLCYSLSTYSFYADEGALGPQMEGKHIWMNGCPLNASFHTVRSGKSLSEVLQYLRDYKWLVNCQNPKDICCIEGWKSHQLQKERTNQHLFPSCSDSGPKLNTVPQALPKKGPISELPINVECTLESLLKKLNIWIHISLMTMLTPVRSVETISFHYKFICNSPAVKCLKCVSPVSKSINMGRAWVKTSPSLQGFCRSPTQGWRKTLLFSFRAFCIRSPQFPQITMDIKSLFFLYYKAICFKLCFFRTSLSSFQEAFNIQKSEWHHGINSCVPLYHWVFCHLWSPWPHFSSYV